MKTSLIKMKNKKYHTAGSIPKSNIKIVEKLESTDQHCLYSFLVSVLERLDVQIENGTTFVLNETLAILRALCSIEIVCETVKNLAIVV